MRVKYSAPFGLAPLRGLTGCATPRFGARAQFAETLMAGSKAAADVEHLFGEKLVAVDNTSQQS